MKDTQYYHHVPKAKIKEDFPFDYKLERVEEDHEEWLLLNRADVQIEIIGNKGLKEKIHEGLINVFPFFDYLDESSPKFIGAGVSKDLKIYIEIIKYKMENNKRKYDSRVILYACNFSSSYRFNLIRSIEQLNKVLGNGKIKRIAFDTETEGLNPEEDKLVGISFSIKEKEGYYIPINHIEDFSEFNLGIEAVKVFYDYLKKVEVVILFNARFDIRVMEFSDDSIDFSNINIFDTQVSSYFSDTGFKRIDLKYLEEHFCGYKRHNLSKTLKSSGITSFNTALIDPRKLLFYACQDAISTFELYDETYKFYKEFKISGQVDMQLLFPLMRMENHPIRIDLEFLSREVPKLAERLREIDTYVTSQIGKVNLNSGKQKEALFKSFGLNTGKKTPKGQMATGKGDIKDMIEVMNAKGEEVPGWLLKLEERSSIEKLYSGFYKSLLEQATESGGRVRVNYRNVNTATGRLSSGAEIQD